MLTLIAQPAVIAHLARWTLVVWSAAACSTWAGSSSEPSALSPGRELSRARLTLRDGGSLIVYNARVRSDSVVGMVRRQGSFQPISVSRDDVRGVQLPEVDELRTLLLVGTIVGGIIWIIGSRIRASYNT